MARVFLFSIGLLFWALSTRASDGDYDSFAADIVWGAIQVLSSGDENLSTDAYGVIAQAGEFGMFWLSRSRRPSAIRQMAYLSFARLDGAYAENYGCHVLRGGIQMAKALARLGTDEYKRFCESQQTKGFACVELDRAMARVKEYRHELRKGRRCEQDG